MNGRSLNENIVNTFRSGKNRLSKSKNINRRFSTRSDSYDQLQDVKKHRAGQDVYTQVMYPSIRPRIYKNYKTHPSSIVKGRFAVQKPRLFSTHAANTSPQPKKPPPPPPTRPGKPVSRQQTSKTPTNDLLSRVSATPPSPQLRPQDKHPQEPAVTPNVSRSSNSAFDRPASAREAQWLVKAERCEEELLYLEKYFQLDDSRVPKDVKSLLNEVRSTAWRIIAASYEREHQRVSIVRTKYDDLEKKMNEWPDFVKSSMVQARVLGTQDHLWSVHCRVSGLSDLVRRVDRVPFKLRKSSEDLADLAYSIDWTRWASRVAHFRTQDTIDSIRMLKAETAPHHQTNVLLNNLSASAGKILDVLSPLNEDALVNRRNLSRRELQIYNRVSDIRDKFIGYGNLAPLGHLWRKTNRYALVESRFPYLIDQSRVEISAHIILTRLRESNIDMANTLKSAGFSRLPITRRAAFRKFQNVHRRYSSMVHQYHLEHMNLLRRGMVLLNPALQSPRGRLKYALLRPFSSYTASSEALRADLRFFIDQHGASKSSHHYPPGSVGWHKNAIKKLYTSLEKLYRPLLRSIEQLSYVLTTRALFHDDSLLKRLFSNMAEQARIEVIRQQTLQGLSKFRAHGSDKNIELVDPMLLRGNDRLYPMKRSYPIEYVTSPARTVQVLHELLKVEVMGLDIVPHDDPSLPAYICIATTEKIVVFECNDLLDLDGVPMAARQKSAFARILEDENILKITHSIRTLQHLNFAAAVSLKSVLSIDQRQTSTPSEMLERKTMTGTWKPLSMKNRETKPFLYFLTDLAFLPVFNIITFLNNMKSKHLSFLHPELAVKIMKAKDHFRSRIFTEGGEPILELGPVSWDNRQTSVVRRRLLSARGRYAQSLPRLLVRESSQIRKDMKGFSNKHAFEDTLALTAYYLFTTFSYPLSLIRQVMGTRTPARDILDIIDRAKLPIHPAGLEVLQNRREDLAKLPQSRDETSTKMERSKDFRDAEEERSKASSARDSTSVRIGRRRSGSKKRAAEQERRASKSRTEDKPKVQRLKMLADNNGETVDVKLMAEANVNSS